MVTNGCLALRTRNDGLKIFCGMPTLPVQPLQPHIHMYHQHYSMSIRTIYLTPTTTPSLASHIPMSSCECSWLNKWLTCVIVSPNAGRHVNTSVTVTLLQTWSMPLKWTTKVWQHKVHVLDEPPVGLAKIGGLSHLWASREGRSGVEQVKPQQTTYLVHVIPPSTC